MHPFLLLLQDVHGAINGVNTTDTFASQGWRKKGADSKRELPRLSETHAVL